SARRHRREPRRHRRPRQRGRRRGGGRRARDPPAAHRHPRLLLRERFHPLPGSSLPHGRRQHRRGRSDHARTAMKIARLETFLANAGLRNYLFVRLTTDTGLTGVGEASLEWQEQTVETLIHEWVEERILGENPFDIERISGALIRDQYQCGATIMTAISGVEIALWDIVGKANAQPVYQLLGGRAHDCLRAYANGWYGGARTPGDYASAAKKAVGLGY